MLGLAPVCLLLFLRVHHTVRLFGHWPFGHFGLASLGSSGHTLLSTSVVLFPFSGCFHVFHPVLQSV